MMKNGVLLIPARFTDWKSVTLSGFSTCGIRSDVELYCWGSNAVGELGLGSL